MDKKNTLQKNWEFKTIIEKHQQVSTKFLVVYYDKNSDVLKIGISISKKFAGAVLRNKYRNQVRNILRNILKEKTGFIKKYKLVIILRKPFLTLNFHQKKDEIVKILGRI